MKGRDESTYLLDQLDEHELGPSVRTKELELVGLALGVSDEAEFLDGSVDRLLGHGSVGRPLPTGDGKKTTLGDVDHVVSDKGLGVLGVRVLDERSKTGPGGEDVSSSDLDFGSKVVLDLEDREVKGERRERVSEA
jgi:hypothetical protein